MRRVLLALTLLCPLLASAASLQALGAKDVPALLQPPARGARLIAIWALDCAYCEPNLQALAALQRAHPRDLQLVTLTTDPIGQRAAIEARLRQAGVADYPARAYADATPERINFLLDPNWGGETPRVLLIRADGTHLGISGELTPRQLQKLR
jgi:iron complex outermembrane receptor protein